jgi:hypothetical protein
VAKGIPIPCSFETIIRVYKLHKNLCDRRIGGPIIIVPLKAEDVSDYSVECEVDG